MKNRRDETETGRRGVKASSGPVSRSLRLPVLRHPSLITLLTDFGTSDYFVGALKGVILSINHQARIVDLTHDIPPQDVATAAFTLQAAYPSFPAGTIHVAVVDPGVGSSRRPIVGSACAQFFVGPDNGIFSYVFRRDPNVQVFHLTREEYFRHPVSATFQGRDVFAPVAAALANGVHPETLGRRINDHVSLPPVLPERLGKGRQRGRILHIDHFGNCITNFTQADLPGESPGRGIRLIVNRKVVKAVRRFFSDEGDHEELFAIWGSAGFLEIAAMNRSAAEILGARRGQAVMLSSSKGVRS